MKTEVSISILSSDFSIIGETVRKLDACGADMIHFDVMDGCFVEPITFGAQMLKSIRKITALPLDVHLMVEHPKTHIRSFVDAGADIITVHYEACKSISESYLTETLELIKSHGVKCGVVVNPDTAIEDIYSVLPICDFVMLMSVYPGYGGKQFIPEVLDKVRKVREYADKISKPELNIEIDGGISENNAEVVRAAGANVLVAGSSVFKSNDMAVTIANLKK